MKDLTDPAQTDTAQSPAPPATPKLTLHLLESRRYPIPGFGAVRARLWRVEPPDAPAAYAVSLVGLGSRRFCLLGREEREARELFRKLVRGRVTPTGLADVLEEGM